ncbi:MAG: VOC family protein [Aggregatilineales bacterium]
MKILSLHHAQITIPPGTETDARAFYCDLLGLSEIEKPDGLKVRGGFWLQVGTQQVHVGTEDFDRTQTKMHLAYEVDDVQAWRSVLENAGCTMEADNAPIPGYARIQCRDPFGNRIEFMQRVSEDDA